MGKATWETTRLISQLVVPSRKSTAPTESESWCTMLPVVDSGKKNLAKLLVQNIRRHEMEKKEQRDERACCGTLELCNIFWWVPAPERQIQCVSGSVNAMH